MSDEIRMTDATAKELEALGIKTPRTVGGLPIQVVPNIDARESTVICMPEGSERYFDDDVSGTCDTCGTAIFHRPHLPLGAITICIYCYRVLVARGEAPDIPFPAPPSGWEPRPGPGKPRFPRR